MEDVRYLNTDFECLHVVAYLDFSDSLLESVESRRRLMKLGLFQHVPTAYEVQERLTRLLFRLKPSLMESLAPTLAEIRKHEVIGFQFRTGGHVANYEEDTVFIRMNRLDSVYRVLHNVSQANHFRHPYLYLSTDSAKVVRQFKMDRKYPLIMYEKYPIGHSSRVRDGNDDTIFRAVSDIYLLSQCNAIITTYTSSFGDLARMLSYSDSKTII